MSILPRKTKQTEIKIPEGLDMTNPIFNSPTEIKKMIKNSMKRDGFFAFPYFINVTSPWSDLTFNQKWIYAHILNYSIDGKICFESPETMGEKLGVAKRTVYQCLKVLKEKKIISTVSSLPSSDKSNLTAYKAIYPKTYKKGSLKAININFIPIYYKVVKNAIEFFPFMTQEQITLYSYLFAQAFVINGNNPNGMVFNLTSKDISNETGLSIPSVKRLLLKFQDWKFIEISSQFNPQGRKSRVIKILCNLMADKFEW